MNKGKIFLFTTLLGTMIVGGVLGFQEWQKRQSSPRMSTFGLAQHARNSLPKFNFLDLEGRERLSTEWQGKVVVLNFWATWCPPCRKEMPAFIELQHALGAKGLQFVGIAIDDKTAVQDFVDTLGVNYPILLGELDAIQISQDLGNRNSGLPFTAIFDRSGHLIHKRAGEIDRQELEEKIVPLLNTSNM